MIFLHCEPVVMAHDRETVDLELATWEIFPKFSANKRQGRANCCTFPRLNSSFFSRFFHDFKDLTQPPQAYQS